MVITVIKIKQVRKFEDIKAGDYIRPTSSPLFERISEIIIDSAGIAYITYGKDAMKDMCEQMDLINYEFGTIDAGSDDIKADVVYRCNMCHNPSVVFEDAEMAIHHTERCLFNPKAKSCVMCKHLKIIEEPPYPRYQKNYESSETYHAFGAFKQPFCMFYDKNITEYNLFDDHEDCFEYSNEPPVTTQTPSMKKYVELINSDIEVQKTTVGEFLKEDC